MDSSALRLTAFAWGSEPEIRIGVQRSATPASFLVGLSQHGGILNSYGQRQRNTAGILAAYQLSGGCFTIRVEAVSFRSTNTWCLFLSCGHRARF